jgi:hypothetical protein
MNLANLSAYFEKPLKDDLGGFIYRFYVASKGKKFYEAIEEKAKKEICNEYARKIEKLCARVTATSLKAEERLSQANEFILDLTVQPGNRSLDKILLRDILVNEYKFAAVKVDDALSRAEVRSAPRKYFTCTWASFGGG